MAANKFSKDVEIKKLVLKLKKQFVIWMTVFVVGLSIATLIIQSNRKHHISDNYAKSVYNFLVIGDQRSSMGILKNSVSSDFVSVSYFGPNNKKVFEVNRDGYESDENLWSGLALGVDRHYMSREAEVDSTGRRLEFKYDRMGNLKIIWIIWLLLMIFLRMLLVSFEGSVRSHFSRALDQQRLMQIGEISRQVAHDIRSPLSALRVATSDLAGLAPNRIELIHAATKRIMDMAEGLLSSDSPDKSKKASKGVGKAEGQRISKVTDITKLVTSCCREKEVLLKDGNIELIYVCPEAEALVNADEMMFQRVFSNLLNNSIESLPDGKGKVEVDLKASKEMALLTIRDNGKGIPEEVLKKLGRESISHGKDSEQGAGSGVGVLHAYREIKACDGTITHQNQPDGGVLVMISLPIFKKPD